MSWCGINLRFRELVIVILLNLKQVTIVWAFVVDEEFFIAIVEEPLSPRNCILALVMLFNGFYLAVGLGAVWGSVK